MKTRNRKSTNATSR